MWDMEKTDKLREKGMISDENYEKIAKHYQKFKAASAKFEPQKMDEGGWVQGVPYPDAPAWDKTAPASPEQTANMDFVSKGPSAEQLSQTQTPFHEPGDKFASMNQAALDTAAEPAPENKVYNYAPPEQRQEQPQATQPQKIDVTTPTGEHFGVSTASPPPQNVQLASDKPSLQGGQDLKPIYNPYSQGYDMQQQGVATEFEAARKKGAEEALQLQSAQKKMEDAEKNRMSYVDQQTKVMDDNLSKMQTQMDKYSEQKIDPNHFWANKSTGDKVLAGIGLFLGAFSQTGSNPAVEVINRAINRDIESQAANIQTQGNALRQKQSLYGDMFNLFKNKETAMAASRVAAYDQAQLALKGIAARYSGVEAQGKAQQMLGQLEIQKQQAQMQFTQQVMKMQALQNPQAYKEFLEPDQRERIVPGYQGLGVSKEGSAKVREAVGENQSAQENINALLKLNDEAKISKTVSPEMKAEIAARYNLLVGHTAKGLFSRVTENELHMVQDAVQNPGNITSWPSAVRKSLETMAKSSQEMVDSKAKAEGLVPMNDAKGITKLEGAPAPMGKLTGYKK